MAAGVVTIGRSKYAVGLYWENSPGSGRVAQTAKEAASQPGQQADFYAVRPGNKNGRIPQFGLTTAEAGQKSGMPVLSACLAAQLPGSWAGAFRLNEGIVLTIVRDDLIVPDGDLYFLDEAEARDRLIQEAGFGGLQTVYAPESWSIPSADTIPLTLLLNDRHDIKLQTVTIPKQLKMIGAGVGLLFVLILGVVWYFEERAAEEAAAKAQQEEALRMAQEEAARLTPKILQHQEQPPPVYDRVWEKAPTVNDMIKNCREGLVKIPAALLGWHMGNLVCTGTDLKLNWSHEHGLALPIPDSSINDTASGANQTIALPAMQPRGSESLLDPEEITRRYLTQEWPGNISKGNDDPLPSPPAGYDGPWNPPPAPWVKRSFTLTVPELPGDLSGLVGDLPGAIITSLTYAPRDQKGGWSVEGVIYENRK
jgi:hypothetical protein